MEEDAGVIREVDFMEIIHVELSNEGGKLVMAEEAREDGLFKLFLVVDANSPFLMIPGNNLGMFLGLS